MELILREESEPVDSVLLVLPELGLDGNGDIVLVDLGSVEELVEELSLSCSFLQHLRREARRIGDSSLRKKWRAARNQRQKLRL